MFHDHRLTLIICFVGPSKPILKSALDQSIRLRIKNIFHRLYKIKHKDFEEARAGHVIMILLGLITQPLPLHTNFHIPFTRALRNALLAEVPTSSGKFCIGSTLCVGDGGGICRHRIVLHDFNYLLSERER